MNDWKKRLNNNNKNNKNNNNNKSSTPTKALNTVSKQMTNPIVSIVFLVMTRVMLISHTCNGFQIRNDLGRSLFAVRNKKKNDWSRNFLSQVNICNDRSLPNLFMNDDYDDDYEYVRIRRRGKKKYRNDYNDEDEFETINNNSRRNRRNEFELDGEDYDEYEYYYEDEDEDDDDFDLDDIVDNMDFSVTIPNPILDNLDPDRATDRMGDLVKDPVFWRDMSIMGVLIWIWAASSTPSFIAGHTLTIY